MVEVGDAVQIHAERDEQIAAVFGTNPRIESIAQVETEAGGGGGQ